MPFLRSDYTCRKARATSRCGHDWRILRVLPRFNIEESTLDAFTTAVDEELEYLCNLV